MVQYALAQVLKLLGRIAPLCIYLYCVSSDWVTIPYDELPDWLCSFRLTRMAGIRYEPAFLHSLSFFLTL